MLTALRCAFTALTNSTMLPTGHASAAPALERLCSRTTGGDDEKAVPSETVAAVAALEEAAAAQAAAGGAAASDHGSRGSRGAANSAGKAAEEAADAKRRRDRCCRSFLLSLQDLDSHECALRVAFGQGHKHLRTWALLQLLPLVVLTSACCAPAPALWLARVRALLQWRLGCMQID